MKLVAILRIKNAISTLAQCMDRLSDLVDEIIVLDNGSTDGSLEVYSKYSKIVKILRTVGYHEGRDKVMLLDEAKKKNPDWILWIDADEVFEKHLDRIEMEKYMRRDLNMVNFRMCNFWLDKKHCRFDREWFLYSLRPQRQMWRNVPSAYFQNIKVHNGGIKGVSERNWTSPYRLKHYGYADKDEVIKKWNLYIKEDTQSGKNYDRLNPHIKSLRYPFWEFKNKRTNLLFAYLFKTICSTLLVVTEFKRRNIRGVRIFPEYPIR